MYIAPPGLGVKFLAFTGIPGLLLLKYTVALSRLGISISVSKLNSTQPLLRHHVHCGLDETHASSCFILLLARRRAIPSFNLDLLSMTIALCSLHRPGQNTSTIHLGSCRPEHRCQSKSVWHILVTQRGLLSDWLRGDGGPLSLVHMVQLVSILLSS